MILDEIVEYTRHQLEEKKKRVPLSEIEKLAAGQPASPGFAPALCGKGVSLIAEIKKASPSRGVIRADFNPAEIAHIYAHEGASAISFMTEQRYFQGSLDYLRTAREAAGGRIPLLRKDFIFDKYQLYEAKAYGADAVLLIVAVLGGENLEGMLSFSRGLGMGCLVEVHNEAELEIALGSGAEVIGINNRDLKTFEVDINTTGRLKPRIPADKVTVSESGIKNRADVMKMKEWGIDAVLVGEALMASPDIAASVRELL
jgi:indole-3-glycerol phosphate synthase